MKPLLLKELDEARCLAAQTPGFSGADIANICNESALIAARKKRESVTKQDFMDAIDRIVAGLEKKSKIITDAEKRIIAHHEAGHAIASWYLKHVDPLVKVSVIPRGKSLGSAWYLPEERQLKTSAEFTDMICASLGGRAAEEIMFGEISSGALDDLEKATKDAYMMVAYFGFDAKLGPISFDDSSGRINGSFQKPYSESTGQLIDEEVRKLIGAAYVRTKELLIRHKPQLIALAGLLLQREMVYKADLEALLGERGEEKGEEARLPLVQS
jgi:AFG3 family protein